MEIQKRKKRKNQFIYRYFLPVIRKFLRREGSAMLARASSPLRDQELERSFL